MNKIWTAIAFLSIGVTLNAQEPTKKNDPKPGSNQQRSINEKGLSAPKTRAIKPKKKDNALNQAPAPTPSPTVTTKKEEKKPE